MGGPWGGAPNAEEWPRTAGHGRAHLGNRSSILRLPKIEAGSEFSNPAFDVLIELAHVRGEMRPARAQEVAGARQSQSRVFRKYACSLDACTWTLLRSWFDRTPQYFGYVCVIVWSFI